MSAYYLKQVVKEWSLLTIYKGMFEFMMLQVIAIALIVIFPAIATWFPERLQAEQRGVVTEEVDQSGTSLEDYQPGGTYGTELREALEQEQQEGEAPAEEGSGDSLEQDEMTTKKK
jgi:hypothetical protein